MAVSGGVIPNNATFKIISRIIEPLLAVFSMVANGLILVAFARCRQLRSRTSNILLIFLAIADLLFVLFTVPFGGLIHHGYPHNYYGCLMLVSLTTLPILLTVSTLLVIAVERFVAIRWPFNQAQYCSQSRMFKSLAMLWIVDAIFCFLPLAGFNNGWNNNGKCSYHKLIDQSFHMYSAFFPLTLVPILIMSAIYSYIFYVVVKMSKTVGPAQNAELAAKESRQKAFAAAKKCGVIIIAFVGFVLPTELLNVVSVYHGFKCSACMRIGSWGLLFHGVVCPVIYLYQNKLLRTVVSLTLRCRPIDAHQLSLLDGAAA